MMLRLVRHGLECTYILLNAVSYIMKEVPFTLPCDAIFFF